MNSVKNILVIILMSISLMANGQTTLYVSPDGNDTDAGTSVSTALKTLDGARAKATANYKNQAVTVLFAPGEYPMTTTANFTYADSRTATSVLTFKAQDANNMPVFKGDAAISGWAKITDADVNYGTLPAAALNNVYVADISGVSDYDDPGTATGSLLIYKGSVQTLARYPNKDAADGGFTSTESIVSSPGTNTSCTVNSADAARLTNWENEPGDIYLGGYWSQIWEYAIQKVTAISATTLNISHNYGSYHYGYGPVYSEGKAKYFAFNLLCELDQEGEYYIDRTNNKLYWWTPAGITPPDGSASLTSLGADMVEIKDCSFITFESIVFQGGRGSAFKILENSAWSSTTGLITRTLTSDITIKDCIVRCFGEYGVKMDGDYNWRLTEGTTSTSNNHRITGCWFTNFGLSAISARSNTRPVLGQSNILIDNNVIEYWAMFKHVYECAIDASGSGIRIAHNRMQHAPSSAIDFKTNDMVIEYNQFSDLVRESGDQGACESYQDMSVIGNIIRYNYWADIKSEVFEHSAAIRLDDAISHQLIYGNVFERVGREDFGAINIHGGRDNRIQNNVFYNCTYMVSLIYRFGARDDWGHEDWSIPTRYDPSWWDSPEDGKMYATDLKLIFTDPNWLERYPALTRLATEPGITVILDNIAYGQMSGYQGQLIHQMMATPPDKDYLIGRNNVQVSQNTPGSINDLDAKIAEYHLQPIPVAEMGPEQGKCRWTDADYGIYNPKTASVF
ncbi:MAG: right-handed parallel beta-helix repeat-containing protein [Tannerella sp.]|jgi:hypothetical protein|nr:right-handed parallel beta-helix repeat-containing protein [Tannerella sp.]